MILFIIKYLREVIETIFLLAIIFFLFYYIFKKGKVKKVSLAIFSICIILLASTSLYRVFTPPNIQLIGGEEVSVEVFDEFSDRGIILTDSIGRRIDVEVVSDDFAVDTDMLGQYRVNYFFKYRNRTYNPSRLVYVIDTQSPEIALNGKEIVAVETFSDYKEPGCKATDNYDGDITDAVQVSYSEVYEHEIEVKYAVQDSSGNTVQAYRTVEIRDITPPKVTLNGYKTVYVIKGEKYKEKGAKASDNRDGDVTNTLQIEGEIDTSKLGTYIIEYSAADSAGNKGTETRKIKVVEPEKLEGNVIYLTFDDGPSDSATEKILNVLTKNNVKATFFIINFDTKKKADLIKRMVNEGHTVAIHGYSHVYEDIYCSEKAFMNNINSLRDKVKSLTGYTSTIMRFPGGTSNTISDFNPGIMTKLEKTVQDEGYIYFDWNIDSADTSGKRYTADKLYHNVTSELKKNRANVVLMHDIGDGARKAKAVQMIIDYGKENGYVFAPITEATPLVRHPVMN